MVDVVRQAYDAQNQAAAKAHMPPPPDGFQVEVVAPPPPDGFSTSTGDPVQDALNARDAQYSTGIFSGSMNPLGPIAKSLDAGASAAQNAATMGFGPAIEGAIKNASGTAPSFDAGREQALAEQSAKQIQNPDASALGNVGGMAMLARSGPQAPMPASGAAGMSAVSGAATGAGYAGANAIGNNVSETGHLPDDYASLFKAALNTGVGMITGAVGGAVGAMNQRPRLSPHATRQVDTLTSEGVPVFAGQATGNPGFQAREAQASGAQAAHEGQLAAFSTAAARRAGIDAPDGHVYGQDLQRAMGDTGAEMTRMATNYDITDPQILNRAFRRASQVAADHNEIFNAGNANRSPVVDQAVTAIGRAARSAVGGGGGMLGTQWQKLSSTIGDAMAAHPGAAKYLGKIRSALADAMEQSITAVNPADAGTWRQLNTQYKNQLVIKRAVEGMSDSSMNRMISPKALASASKQIEGGTAKANQTSSYHDLAEAGVAMLKPMKVDAGGMASNIRDLRSGLATGAMGSAAMGASGMNPAIGAGAVLAPMAGSALYDVSRLALRPMNSLSPFGQQIGAGIGAQAGVAAANPFQKLAGGQ